MIISLMNQNKLRFIKWAIIFLITKAIWMRINIELDVGEWLPLEDLYMKAFGLIIYKKEKEE